MICMLSLSCQVSKKPYIFTQKKKFRNRFVFPSRVNYYVRTYYYYQYYAVGELFLIVKK